MKRREFYLELSRKLQNGETVKVRTDLEKGSHSFEEPGEGTFFEEEFAGRTQVVVFGGGHISLALEKVRKRWISLSRWWMTGWNLQTGSVFRRRTGC